jgi:crotonobetainyl-CoA:carnitine CoA-transferase CaiB-like acyl-CoA transferase
MALEAIVSDWLARFKTDEEALAALRAARVPCAPVLTPEEVVAHPHLAAREAFPEVKHPVRGKVKVTTAPIKFSGSPVGPAGEAPYRPGENGVSILAEVLGYGPEQIERLVQAGAVFTPS